MTIALPIIPPRPLTAAERSLTKCLIEHCDASDVQKLKYLAQLEHAAVISRCTCGCASVDFGITGIEIAHAGGEENLGDFMIERGGIAQHGVRLFTKAGSLAGIDIYTLGN